MERRKLAIILILILILQVAFPILGECVNIESSESSENYAAASKVITISNLNEFKKFADNVNAGNSYSGYTINLKNSINLANKEWTPIGKSEKRAFAGNFNGNNYTITGLKITQNNGLNGLFGVNKGTIQNLTVTGTINITSTKEITEIGGIAAENDETGTIKNCKNNVKITLKANKADTYNDVGGITGDNFGKIENCYNNSSIEVVNNKNGGVNEIGGIAGSNSGDYGNVSKTGNNGTVTNSGASYSCAIGGIVGSNEKIIAKSYNTKKISSELAEFQYVGGIAGDSYGKNSTVSNCYNTAQIYSNRGSKENMIGGIVGLLGDESFIGTIQNCYNIGQIASNNEIWNSGSGSIVGKCGNSNCVIKNTYYLKGTVTNKSNLYKEEGNGSLSGEEFLRIAKKTHTEQNGKAYHDSEDQWKNNVLIKGFPQTIPTTIVGKKNSKKINCSAYVSYALYEAGFKKFQGTQLESRGIEDWCRDSKIKVKEVKIKDIQKGDIVLYNCGINDGKKHHTNIYVGSKNNQRLFYDCGIEEVINAVNAVNTNFVNKAFNCKIESYPMSVFRFTDYVTDKNQSTVGMNEKDMKTQSFVNKLGSSVWKISTSYPVLKSSAEDYVDVENPAGEFPTFEITEKESYTSQDGLVYQIEENEEITIIGYEGESKVVIIPAQIDSKKVTEISENAFEGKNISSISVSSSVQKLGESAFANCDELEKVDFASCSNLKNIANNMFSGCKKLTQVILPPNLENIDEYAFAECTSIHEIEIPNTTVKIDNSAFENCTSLETVLLGESSKLVEIGESAFSGCSKLYKIGMESSITSENPLNKLPDNTEIAAYSFQKCSALERISINQNIIYAGTFENCTNLSKVHERTSENVTIQSRAFANNENLAKVYARIREVGDSAFTNNKKLTQITLTEDAIIKENAFDGCDAVNICTKNAREFSEKITNIVDDQFIGNVNVQYSSVDPSRNSVIVTITSSEEIIQPLAGWNISEGRKVLSKIYSENTDEELIIQDVAGNEYSQKIHIQINNLSKIAPKVTISDFSDDWQNTPIPVEIDAQIANEKVQNVLVDGVDVTLEDGKYIADYENGVHQVIVKDTAGNETRKSFEITNFDDTAPVVSDVVEENGIITISGLEKESGVKEIKIEPVESQSNTENLQETETILDFNDDSEGNFTARCKALDKTTYKISVVDNAENVSNVTDLAVDKTYENQEGQIIYEENQEGTATVKDYTGSELEVEIPSQTPNGFTITKIGANAFNSANISKITLPETVQEVENNAFARTKYLHEINLENVSKIGEYAFKDSGIESVKLSIESVEMGEGVFENCHNLKNIGNQLAIENITKNLFANCSSLESIMIKEGVEEIDDYAFYRCSKLKEIVLPNTLKVIDSYAFNSCSRLEEIELSNKLEYIGAESFAATGLKKIEIPKTVTHIELGAFRNCAELEKVDIPRQGLKTMASEIFFGCYKLKYFIFPDTITYFEGYQKQNHYRIFESQTKLYWNTYSSTPLAYRENDYGWIWEDDIVPYVVDGQGYIYATENVKQDILMEESTSQSESQEDDTSNVWTQETEKEVSTIIAYNEEINVEEYNDEYDPSIEENILEDIDYDDIEDLTIENTDYDSVGVNSESFGTENDENTKVNNKKKEKSIEIPTVLGGRDVGIIGAGAFENTQTISEIILPETVSEIRDEAFANNENLDTLIIKNAGTNIIGEDMLKGTEDLVMYSTVGSQQSEWANLYGVSSKITDNNIVYEIDEQSKTAKVCAIENNPTTVEIPLTIGSGKSEYVVTEIQEGTFSNNNNLENIIIYALELVIADDVFEGIFDLELYCYEGASAEEYGKKKEYKINYLSEGMDPRIVELDKQEINLDIGDEEILTAKVYPSIAGNKKINWISSDEEIVTIQDGVIKAIGSGRAIVTAMLNANNNIKAECVVTVKQKQEDQQIINLGDINGDGKISIFDRLCVSKHIAAEEDEIKRRHPDWELTDSRFIAADIDKNNEITGKDKLLISRHIVVQLDPIIGNKHPDWKIQN